MKPTLTIGAAGLAMLFLFGGLVYLSEKAEAYCVRSLVWAEGHSSALKYSIKKRRAFRRAHRAWRRYVKRNYGSPFSHFGYARYKREYFYLNTGHVEGKPCDANR